MPFFRCLFLALIAEVSAEKCFTSDGIVKIECGPHHYCCNSNTECCNGLSAKEIVRLEVGLSIGIVFVISVSLCICYCCYRRHINYIGQVLEPSHNHMVITPQYPYLQGHQPASAPYPAPPVLVEHIEERTDLREDPSYLKAQSMRNNLIFTGVPENNTAENETPDVTEKKLREHLFTALHIQKEVADTMKFERVHRTSRERSPGKPRSIVAKFAFFKDRETVRRQRKHLSGSGFNVFEQFPPEVVAKRRKLLPKMREARAQGKRAWIAFDTLYVDGRPVKD